MFQELKNFLTTPLMLSLSNKEALLYLYLSSTNTIICPTLVREKDEEENPIYLINKVFKEVNYATIIYINSS